MAKAQIGIIGGTGLYSMLEMTEVEELDIATPFGKTVDPIVLGTLEGARVAFLSRHGIGHRVSPSELPAKANIYALKSLGVERIISISAVGSLTEEIQPLDLVIPDQIIDHTSGRDSTFFGGGIVVHVAFAEPFCPVLSRALLEAAAETGARVHQGGTLLVMEGPQLSTKAESQLYRAWGAHIIGMTALPEAKLAREAELCYATLAFVTDYDCWHPSYDSVTVDMILTNLRQGVDTGRRFLKLVMSHIPKERDCACATALQGAIATGKKYIPDQAKKDLDLLIGKYLNR